MINKPVWQCTVRTLFSVMHSALVVIQYIVEYCTYIKLKMAKRKLQTELSLQQKSEVLLRIQKGESQRKLGEQYGVSKKTIANIKKNEHFILYIVESNCSQNRKSMVFKGESFKGGKFTKERLSIMLCCSATREKLKPLVIGNAARPRAF